MTKKFKFVHVVVGEIPARNKAQAYMLVQMSVSIASRLLQFPNNVSVRILEIEEPEPELSVAEHLFKGREAD